MRWSLSELEDIVFDFINAHELPPEFLDPAAHKGKDKPQPSVNDSHHGKQRNPRGASRGVTFSKGVKQDVSKEDLMKVARVEKDKGEDNLPQMVREYILHDRGNSLFLGDSFGNLPSPVHEDPTIKKLFKFNEDEPLDKQKKNDSRN